MNYIQKFFSKFATIKVSERNTISFTVNNSLYKILPLFSSIILILSFFPLQPIGIKGGLDPSWMLFINSIYDADFLAGKDFFFTYGPLGFLFCTLNINHHILVTSLFYLILCVIDFYLLFKLLCTKERNIINFLVILLIVLIAIKSNVTGDSFIVFTLMLFMKEIWNGSVKFTFLFVLLTSLLFLVKFISFYIALSMVIIYVPCNYFFNRNIKQILIMSMALPLAIVFYLIYNPSFIDLYHYIESAVYISMGMNSGLSLVNCRRSELFILFPFAFYIACSILFFFIYKSNKKNAALFLILFSSQFFFYKEGFVRHGGEFAFIGCNVFLIILLLCIDIPNDIFSKSISFNTTWLSKTSLYSLILMIVLSVTVFDTIGKNFSVDRTFFRLRNFEPNYRHALRDDGHNVSHIPQEFKSIIDNDTFTVFPWELSYGYKQSNFRPMPIIQNYTAYNKFLDQKNADFYRSENAPKYIIFNLDVVDERIPLIETPQTWSAIADNYFLVKKVRSNNSFVWNQFEYLLERKDSQSSLDNSHNYIFLFQNTIENSQKVVRPSNATHFSFDYSYGVIGNLAKLLWKMPEIRMAVYFENGKVLEGRILLETLGSKFRIDSLSNLLVNDEKYKFKWMYKNIDKCSDSVDYSNVDDSNYMQNLLSKIDVSKVKYIELKDYGMYFVSKVEVNWYRED